MKIKMDKFLNEALIGNKNILATYTGKGELQRLYFPERSIRQYVNFNHVGIKINDSGLIYLHEDINNTYKQYYMDLSSNDFDNKIYPFTQTISEFPNTGIEIHITLPGTKFPGYYYFIFDYYFSNSQRCTINVLNKTYITNYNKILIRLNNTDKFELNAQLYGSSTITALGYDYLIHLFHIFII